LIWRPSALAACSTLLVSSCMKASDLRRPSSLRCKVSVRNGPCAAQSAIDGITSDRIPATTSASSNTATTAAAAGGK
jgi:hypothetical protein